MKKYKTNTELVMEIMHSSTSGPMMQAFVICAIEEYAKSALESAPWPESTMISQEAWNLCAKDALERIEGRDN